MMFANSISEGLNSYPSLKQFDFQALKRARDSKYWLKKRLRVLDMGIIVTIKLVQRNYQ